MKKQELSTHKPLLARSLRGRRRTGSSEGRHHEVPSKLSSSLILEVNGKAVTFLSRRLSVSCNVCPYVLCSCVFRVSVFLLVCSFPKQVREARRIFKQRWEQLGCAPDARTAVPGQERASSSRFASTKGIHCVQLGLNRVYTVFS